MIYLVSFVLVLSRVFFMGVVLFVVGVCGLEYDRSRWFGDIGLVRVVFFGIRFRGSF